ncbi:hypothetical protein [Actinoplanes couchii]|uniref:hypothetical protein n=1 Tax=Actinoplanes couchii TaxID=403638 RepID=UPI0019453891|nr:hypothetical protein [Actinoplanes couchii]MDR6316374.1 hypothetical protein [Actinoplanes couchii]
MWETIEHIADDLFAYAAQISLDSPPQDDYVGFGWRNIRPDGPALTVYAREGTTPHGLIDVLLSSGGLLSATVLTAPADRRAFHPYGVSDPVGFAAMGVIETLVHMHDVATALDVPWAPPEDLCDRALRRLFPDAPESGDRWADLLWATGRTELPGLPRRTGWRWDGTVQSR